LDALKALQEVRTLQEVLDLQDKAEAISRYTQQADYGNDVIDEASVIKLVAERRLGELLAEMPLPKAAPGNQYTARVDRSHCATGPPGLKKLGISKSRSSRAQQIATLPKSKFDAYISKTVASGQQPTVAGVLKIVKQRRAVENANRPLPQAAGFVTDLATLISEGRRLQTIVADPPWRHDNQASRAAATNHYSTMTLDEICRVPVAEVAAKNCHLHLWATSPLLPDAFKVIEAWGFIYKSSFIWIKRQMGLGNYWRGSHEICLLAIKNKLVFRDHAQRSWLEADRTKHSAKPPEFRRLVEKVSPGPYLELFGRTPPPNSQWTIFGNELTCEEEQ
jgi:N6-adenosine-specific RNA methylase IME4